MLYYKVLGFEDTKPTKEELKKAYYRLSKKHHSDKGNSNEEVFKKIGVAYNFLIDDEKRKDYDESIAQGRIHREESFFASQPIFTDQRQTPHPKAGPQSPKTIFDCLTVSIPKMTTFPMQIAGFISKDQHVSKNESGDTPLHVLIKKLFNNNIDQRLCLKFVGMFIMVLHSQGKLNSLVLNEQDREGNTVLDLLKKAEKLSNSCKKDISLLISQIEELSATATTKAENKKCAEKPEADQKLIDEAQKEFNRIKTSGCGFFMSQNKHSTKLTALQKAIGSKDANLIHSALKMHRSIAPFHISNPESAKALKR